MVSEPRESFFLMAARDVDRFYWHRHSEATQGRKKFSVSYPFTFNNDPISLLASRLDEITKTVFFKSTMLTMHSFCYLSVAAPSIYSVTEEAHAIRSKKGSWRRNWLHSIDIQTKFTTADTPEKMFIYFLLFYKKIKNSNRIRCNK